MTNKNTIKAAALFCIALCITSCSSDDTATTESESPVALQVSAGIGESLTRAVGTQWTSSDAIGVRVTNASANSDMTTLYKNVKYTIETLSTDNTTADFEAADNTQKSTVIFFQDKSETATFAAYAPYSESEPNALPGTNGKITVETSKNNGSTTAQETIDYIYAEGATASFTNPEAKFTKLSDTQDYSFHHKMARLVLTVKAGKGFSSSDILSDEADLKFTFNLGGLIHEGTFDVTTGTAATTGTAVDDWDITECANTEVTTSGSESRTYTLILLPQDLSSKPLTLSATSNEQTYVNSKLIAPNMEAGKSYAYTITVNKTGVTISGCTISDWTPKDNGGVEAK